MNRFEGFTPGAVAQNIPDQFFRDLLPLIDDVNELKLTLFVLWALGQMEEAHRYLTKEDMAENGFDETTVKAAVGRGTLITTMAGNEKLYFLNSLDGKNAVDAIIKGDWQPSGESRQPVNLPIGRPNIFRMYEQHIGALTPMMSDTLQDAENEYPASWIEEALRIAVENNVRKWRYVQAILDRWKREGRDDRSDQGHTKPDYKKYLEGEFAEYLKR